MTVFLIIAAVFTCIAALVGTLLVGKDISAQMKEYETEGDAIENEIARSHEYETKSVSVNIKSLSWIYIVLVLVVIFVCIGIFFY
ncbi:hypothetical protein KHA93_05170 [Bacillus sp. FJAT-49732]|uniref:Uncharacterized protein n=1 Tax=Lederbergia citrisecunda TaxID=2833583 RepID=A0A942TJ26_9BACI|nr:hypothetical protein [Lederbergia citrisecunda]MBS4199046.1 hypothetical protein [Lederbergia citrisecunda]